MSLDDLRAQGRRTLYVREVAEFLLVTQQHVINLIKAKQLGGIRVGDKRKFWKVPLDSLQEFLDRRSTLSG